MRDKFYAEASYEKFAIELSYKLLLVYLTVF